MGTPTASECAAALIRRARKRRGWTQQRLADVVAEHGGRIGRGTVAKLEAGGRPPTIDEWLHLAAALNVAPPLLLLPIGSQPRVAITPRSEVDPLLALEWLRGDEPLTTSKRQSIDTAGWLEGSEPLRQSLKLRGVQDAQNDAAAALQRAEAVGDDEQVRAARGRHHEAVQGLHEHLRTMQRAGITIPAQRADTLEAMEAIGLDVDGINAYDFTKDLTPEELTCVREADLAALERLRARGEVE